MGIAACDRPAMARAPRGGGELPEGRSARTGGRGSARYVRTAAHRATTVQHAALAGATSRYSDPINSTGTV
jgi:hypothetical protein